MFLDATSNLQTSITNWPDLSRWAKRASLTTSFFTQFRRHTLALISSTLLSSLILISTPSYSLNNQPNNQPNALSQNSSPYLAMHGTDPVDWQLWEADVLERAQKTGKLIFISSGYFSCHWCHVMQAESYQDAKTAQFLNEHFVSVKIDRELNPEMDKTLIEFAKKTTGQAGWPQHVVLTPEGYPFAAFIYLPNADFNTTLQNIYSAWQSQPNKIRQLAESAVSLPDLPKKSPLDPLIFEQELLTQLDRLKDEFSGGLKGSSKFPEAPLLNALLQISELPDSIEEWLISTLDQMQTQHLIDHVHGGFYRYTVDPEWQTPHFEKMTYSSALLATTYLQAGKRFQRDDYLKTAKQTLSYLEKHLYNTQTQLYQSSQSAIDQHSEEGGDYLWTKERLKNRLTNSEFEAVEQAWSLQNSAPYDLGWHPKPLSPTNDLLWQKIRLKLQTPVKQIPVDHKSILGWNGLILSAYAQAYAILKEPLYLQKANALADRLYQLIQSQNPPRALSKSGAFMGEANLQDYAFIYQGLKEWLALTNQKSSQVDLKRLEKTVLNKFYSASGWQYHASPLLPGQHNEWQMPDNAIPSPAAIMSCLPQQALDYASQAIMKQPLRYASYLHSLKQCSSFNRQ